MPGMFDDLVPQQQAAKPAGGMFDDLVPAKPASSPTYDAAASGVAGAGTGMAHFLGAAGDLRNLASQATSAAGNALGISPQTIDTVKDVASRVAPAPLALGPTSADVQHGMEKVTGEFHKPETTAGKYAETMGEFAGNPGSYLGPGGMASKGISALLSGAASEAAGQAFEGTSAEGPARLAGGFLGGPLAARAVKPQLAPAQQMLADAGVTQMTPGQLAGGYAKQLEDKLTSFPILGDFITNARGRSIESFNRAVGNQALEPIGERIAAGTAAGHDTVAEVHSKLDDAYNRLVPQLHFIPDNQFAHDIASIQRDAVGTMPHAAAEQFERILNNRLHPDRWVQQINLPPSAAPGSNTLGQQATQVWGLQGRNFKNIESELTNLSGNYAKSTDAGQRQLGEALGDVVRAMRGNIERMNPDHADELRRINLGWAMYSRMRGAAANRTASQGVFTPNDLLSAVKRGDNSVGKGVFARGDALMQDFASAAQGVLPSKVPDSGTSQRTLTSILAGGGLTHFLGPKPLAAVGAASAPYLRPAMYLAHRYTQPTAGAREAFAQTGRGAGMLRPLLQVNPFSMGSNPYSQ